jgi:hypothetical protein
MQISVLRISKKIAIFIRKIKKKTDVYIYIKYFYHSDLNLYLFFLLYIFIRTHTIFTHFSSFLFVLLQICHENSIFSCKDLTYWNFCNFYNFSDFFVVFVDGDILLNFEPLGLKGIACQK